MFVFVFIRIGVSETSQIEKSHIQRQIDAQASRISARRSFSNFFSMIFNKIYRSPARVDLCDFNDLIFRIRNPKNFSNEPIHLASRVVLLPKTNISNRKSTDVDRSRQRKKRTAGIDVYRTLVRPETLSLNSFERESFTDSFIIDRISPSTIKKTPTIVRKMPPSSPMIRHLTTPVDRSDDEFSQTDIEILSFSNVLPKKRLHVYLP